jgi:hypothetical protein
MAIIKEVKDRKLPTKHDPEHKESQEKGHTGIGHNTKSHSENHADFGMGVDTAGPADRATTRPAKDAGKVSGTMPSFLGRQGGY